MEIQDFGEKIGGAKKDLWKERGLSVDDLLEMNDEEKALLIKKDNIWKKPNYQEMVSNGLPIRIAYFIKTIRDATPTKPIFYYNDDDFEKKIKQENYINFVTKLRDFVMNLSTENDVLNFYDTFMNQYIIRNPNSNYVNLIPSAYAYIDNKLLSASQVNSFSSIDRSIAKKQFCYTEDEKLLSNFDIYVLDNVDVKIQKDNSDKTVIEIKESFGKTFLYPKNDFSDISKWKENTIFITSCNKIIANNFESIDAAEKFILETFKNVAKTSSKNKKTRFVPKQLKGIVRTGENYRNNQNITGEDMLKVFNFKGGEFGNWLTENDRQQSLNYGYDALLDLSKALSILPTDISLGNRLSIAFGSRGSGNALAHYEPLREVINLTKMKGAGSLAHEWAHALDNIIGKQLGLSGFMTDNFRYSDPTTETIKNIVETMKYKITSNDEITKQQKQAYEKQITKLTNHINSFFPEQYLNEEQINKKNQLIENIIDNSEKASDSLIDYLSKGAGNKDIDELSNFRKNTVGRVISKEDRINIARLQHSIISYQKQIGQPQKVETDFYNNSLKFDKLHSKTDYGYWSSNIEMFARCFACYVRDKLNYRSDYLCGHSDSAVTYFTNKDNEVEILKAFPEGEERTLINEKIDKLIEFLKEKNILHDYKTQEINKDIVDEMFE